jgi:hypothetical protein
MRTCVPTWIIKLVCLCLYHHGMGAHDVLFSEDRSVLAMNGKSICYLDCVAGSFGKSNPILYSQIRSRVWAATRFNGSASEVRSILSH